MQTSLQGIAKKAKGQPEYRFRNLSGMFSESNLRECFSDIRKNAASGVDHVSAREYEQNLEKNIENLVERLKKKAYRAKLVRRKYIPKDNGKVRPLGIFATEDKLVQAVAAEILKAIYEQDFLPSSYGYRPNVGAREAVSALSSTLQFGTYGYVVEADIKGYFDNIDHDWLIRMLELRIDDESFLRLIKKWLNAGVLDTDGKVVHPVTGTPQGGIVSPLLANVYLHYVLDLWFAVKVKAHCRGKAYLVRYADDFVCAFEREEDAQWFYEELGARLKKFGLTLSAEKTRVIAFDRQKDAGNTSFDFLGFEFRWGTDRKGKPNLKRRTSRKKLRSSKRAFTEWCQGNRHERLPALMSMLKAKLRGYYNYYGVIGNSKSLNDFYRNVKRTLHKWLNRRSQRHSYTWAEFATMLVRYAVPQPRITQRPQTQLLLRFT
jgi:group II intron reverse transcriptase/maturase